MDEYPDLSRLDDVYGRVRLFKMVACRRRWPRRAPPKAHAVKRRLSSFALRRRNPSTVDHTRRSCDLREYLFRGQQ